MERLERLQKAVSNHRIGRMLPERVKDVLWGLPALFLMRIPLFLNLYILGPAYLCLMLRRPFRGRICTLWCLIGAVSIYSELPNGKYILLVILLCGTEEVLRHTGQALPSMARSMLQAMMLPISALLAAVIWKTPYQFLMVSLESIVFLIWILLYQMGADRLWQQSAAGFQLSEEEGCAVLAVSLGTFLAILPWSAVWKGLLLFLCLEGAYYRGISYGLLFSLPAAAVLRMMERTGDSFLLLCILTVMISSFFRELGKGAVALGGVLGGLVLLLLFQGQVVVWELASLCGAGLCFIWVPGKLYERFLWGRTLQEEAGAGEVRTMQQHMSRMLSRSSAAMEELGTVLRESNREKSLNSLDTGRILEDLSERVCGSCEYHSSCWGERFSETYETIGAIMEAARYKGIIEKKDIPLFFLNRCNNSEEFIKRTNRHYELYRLNLSWENRMRRGAQIAAEELGCMAGMLQNLRNYLCTQLELDQNMSRRLQEELARGNLPVQRSQVLKDLKTGRYTLNMQIGTGYNKKLKVQLESRVSALLGIPIQVTDSRMIRQGLWDWKMEETCRLRVDGCILSKGVEIVSGDSTWMGQLPGGRYVAAISDGMGVGERAGGESERALRLLRLILNAGAEEAEAIRLLNSMLLLSGDGEHFSTIDMAVMNLYTGSVHIAKAGSAATILKRQGRIQIYRSDNVPVGIIEKAEWEVFQDQADEGDWIILASDGVFDQREGCEAVERRIRQVLLEEAGATSRQMARRIFDSVRGCGARDDMTVIAMKIGRK